MGKLFGTDGIRGVVGENLTADMAFRVGQAVGTVLMEDKGSRPTVVIGKDTRISSDMLESALMAGLCSVGSDVKPVGTIPTPAVAYLTVQEKADAGIVISASHNPYEHNGIKVFSGQGYKLSDSVEARIEEKILSQEPMKLRTRGEIGRRHHGMRQLKRDYIDFVASTIESDLAGLKILADCANGAASATAPELFGRFKARTDFIHRDPDGVNINSHCGSTHLEDLAAAVVRGGYDISAVPPEEAAPALLKVNINTASAEELDGLPGIGPVLAQRIVDEREANGPYTGAEDLTRVEGIVQAIVESIQDHIITEDTQE